MGRKSKVPEVVASAIPIDHSSSAVTMPWELMGVSNTEMMTFVVVIVVITAVYVSLFLYMMLKQEKKAFPGVKGTTFTAIMFFWMLGSFVFGLISMPFQLLGSVKRGEVAQYFSALLARWLQRTFIHVPTVNGLENMPKKEDGPVIYVMNHCSTLDVCSFYYLGNMNFVWVAKFTTFLVPGVGLIMNMAGYVPLKRGSKGSVKQMFADCRKRIDKGWSVAMFPQGTRRRTKILDFKIGAYTLAKEANIPIVPITLYLPLDLYAKNPKEKCTITVHKMIKPGDPSYKDADTMMKDTYQTIIHALPYGKEMLAKQELEKVQATASTATTTATANGETKKGR